MRGAEGEGEGERRRGRESKGGRKVGLSEQGERER